MFSGSIPALVTPFTPDGAFDAAAYREFVESQIAEGSPALVACGTTGEAATLTADEHFEVVRVCVEQANGRLPVIAGAGSNDTGVAARTCTRPRTPARTRHWWSRPITTAQARRDRTGTSPRLPAKPRCHSSSTTSPRTVTDLQPATLARIAREFPEIFVGLKDSSGVLARVSEHRATLGPNFVQLTGNDETVLAFNAMGGIGCISVTANVAPRLCAALQAACRAGDYAEALRLQDRLFPLHAALFTDASPGQPKMRSAVSGPVFPRDYACQ